MRLPETPARGTCLEERFRAWRQQGDSPEGLKERTTPRPLWPFMLIAVLTSLVMTLGEVGKARATVDLFTIDGQSVVLSAIEQNREEVWNWFNPGVVKGGLDENQYNFLGSWIRAGWL